MKWQYYAQCQEYSVCLFPIPAGNYYQVDVDRFVEESLKMSRFRHAHVMGLYGVCLDADSTPFIIMPYMANGSLLQYLKRERDNIVILEDNDPDDVNIFTQLYDETQSVDKICFLRLRMFASDS